MIMPAYDSFFPGWKGKLEESEKTIMPTLLLSVLFVHHHHLLVVVKAKWQPAPEEAAREDGGGKARQGICHASQQSPWKWMAMPHKWKLTSRCALTTATNKNKNKKMKMKMFWNKATFHFLRNHFFPSNLTSYIKNSQFDKNWGHSHDAGTGKRCMQQSLEPKKNSRRWQRDARWSRGYYK